MLLAKDVKDDIKAARKIRLPWWVLLCLGIVSLPTYWLFDHFGKFGLALPTLNSVLVVGFTIAVKWKLRRHTWFWGTMAILAALHVPLILFVPWTTKWVPALAIAAIDSGDLIVMLAILAVVAKFMEGPNAPEG
jgi:hypothetical protein